jgi:hypothetical protein
MIHDKFEVVRIRVDGDWCDGWLYKEHMLLWARDGFLHVLPIKRIIQYLERETGSTTAVVLEYLLFRNDWKASEQFRRILEIPTLKRRFVQSIRSCRDVITIPEALTEAVSIEATPGILLDTEIYANRVYLATTEGLFESYFNSKLARVDQPMVARLGHRTRQVCARYGSVNAAAEEEGLWFAPVLFGEERWQENGETSFERIAESSLSASFSSRNLLNYTEDPTPAFLRAEAVREKLHARANWDEWRVVSYQRPADITQLTELALRSAHRVEFGAADAAVRAEDGSITALGNWDYRLLLSWGRSLHTINLSAYEEHDIEARPGSFNQVDIDGIDPSVDILSTYPIAGGFLVELFDRILLITPTGAHAFFQGAAGRIKTFTQSRRYQDVALIVEENGLSLIGSFQI